MGGAPGRQSGQMSGIILDAGTESGLPQHLDIEIRPLRDPLCLDQLVFALEILHPLLQSLLQYCRSAALIFSCATT